MGHTGAYIRHKNCPILKSLKNIDNFLTSMGYIIKFKIRP
jgi:hypothetical protein